MRMRSHSDVANCNHWAIRQSTLDLTVVQISRTVGTSTGMYIQIQAQSKSVMSWAECAENRGKEQSLSILQNCFWGFLQNLHSCHFNHSFFSVLFRFNLSYTANIFLSYRLYPLSNNNFEFIRVTNPCPSVLRVVCLNPSFVKSSCPNHWILSTKNIIVM